MELVNREESVLGLIQNAMALLLDGHGNEIDLARIQREAPEMAASLGELINIVSTTHHHMASCMLDMPIINQHLSHISKTTEAGVLTVLNTSEAIMNDALKIKEILDDIERHSPDADPRKQEIQSAQDLLNSIQDNSFSILTSLEFEDANRQLMEKIIQRLEDQLAHSQNILALFKKTLVLHQNDSVFLQGLKHIIDLENTSRQSQDMIDDYFEDFG